MDDFASEGRPSHSSSDEYLNDETKSDGIPVLNLSAIKAEDYLTTQLITRGTTILQKLTCNISRRGRLMS